MAISVFPAGGGEFVTNDFVVDMNETTNNVIDLGRAYAAGAYDVSLASGDTSFDIYALDTDGNSVGYTNDATLVTSGEFTSVVILGVATDERITFAFSGASNDATSEGDATGAGAYLTSISPSDLPDIDDTANIVGGNFATDVEIYFESGTVSTQAKNVVRSDSTALVVTRPDVLDPALDPWDVKAINPGITPPTGSNAHILAGTVDAGASPVWTTTSPLTAGTLNQAYLATVVATDADAGQTVYYEITSGSLATGLTFGTATGVISGTPTTTQDTFEITAFDGQGGSNPRSFDIPLAVATGGSVSTVGNYTVHTFNASDDFITYAELTDVEYFIVAGGGAGGGNEGAGGGGGGLLSSISGFQSGSATSALSPITIPAGTAAVVVGAGGAGAVSDDGAPGSDSVLTGFATAIGGGGGAWVNGGADSGGSGGGSSFGAGNAGSGTSGQGFSGGNTNNMTGGGGGAAAAGESTNGSDGGDGGAGLNNFEGNGYAAGGGGGNSSNTGTRGEAGSDKAGAGGFSNNGGGSGTANFGGGGGGTPKANAAGGSGGSGKVIVRYEV